MFVWGNPKGLPAKFPLPREPNPGIVLIHRTGSILPAGLNEAPRIVAVLPKREKKRDRTIRKSSEGVMADNLKARAKDQSQEGILINILLNRP